MQAAHRCQQQQQQTWLDVHPTAALKVLQILASDDVVGAARDAEALLGAFLLDQRHKGIGATAEVHHGVAIMQIEGEHLGDLPQEDQLCEVAAIAAVPATAPLAVRFIAKVSLVLSI